MSQREPTAFEQDQLRFTCSTCHMKPGDWCTTRAGASCAFLHTKRGTVTVNGHLHIDWSKLTTREART